MLWPIVIIYKSTPILPGTPPLPDWVDRPFPIKSLLRSLRSTVRHAASRCSATSTPVTCSRFATSIRGVPVVFLWHSRFCYQLFADLLMLRWFPQYRFWRSTCVVGSCRTCRANLACQTHWPVWTSGREIMRNPARRWNRVSAFGGSSHFVSRL